MTNRDILLKIRKLVAELRKILKANIHKDRQAAAPAIERAKRLRDEIQSYGFPVSFLIKFEVSNFDIPRIRIMDVDVKVYKVKGDLSPQAQKIYDDWFTKISGLQPD
ncbi:MAG: hypothetical protein Q8O87_01090 [bacterium]|nr:hypothetical protein [bacterium]